MFDFAHWVVPIALDIEEAKEWGLFETMEKYGFQFVKAGVFYLADEPWKGNDKTGPWAIRASLKLVDDQFRKADETVYLIFSDDELKYVGEYTYKLEDRWLYNEYVNHHKYKEIEEEISEGKVVSMWLAVLPYCEAGEIKQLNISKSLEHEIIKQCSPEWNKRNQTKKWEVWRSENCIKVSDIVKNLNI